MEYRELPPDEWSKVAPIFHFYGALLPATELAHIFVAEDDEGKIVGFLTLQLVPHMEPMWVEEQERGRVSLLKLAKMAEGHLGAGTYFVSSSDERIQKLYKKFRMHPVSGVWSKTL